MNHSLKSQTIPSTTLRQYLRQSSFSVGIVVYVLAVVLFVVLSVALGNDIIVGVVSLSLAFVIALGLIHWNTKQRADTIGSSIARIEEACHAIVRDGVLVRLPLDTSEARFRELANAYEAINALADKAIADIEAMNKLEQVRTQFLANVSHELRTPIFAVQGFLETLIDGALDDEAVRRQFVEKAYSNTMRLNTLLTDLIDLSRIESGEIQFTFRYFSLIPVIQEAFAAAEARSQEHNVSLSLEVDKDREILAYGDRDRIYQVLNNLIENGIKYNKNGGKLSVRVESMPGKVLISVQDNGLGIAKEHQGRVFERFYRVDPARSRKVGGTGLGLAITKHILEAHKSTLQLESELGVGTTISFTLKR